MPCLTLVWVFYALLQNNIIMLLLHYSQSMGSLAIGRGGQKLELWMSGLDKAVVAYRECWQIFPCTRTCNNNSAWSRRSTNKRIESPSIHPLQKYLSVPVHSIEPERLWATEWMNDGDTIKVSGEDSSDHVLRRGLMVRRSALRTCRPWCLPS